MLGQTARSPAAGTIPYMFSQCMLVPVGPGKAQEYLQMVDTQIIIVKLGPHLWLISR